MLRRIIAAIFLLLASGMTNAQNQPPLNIDELSIVQGTYLGVAQPTLQEMRLDNDGVSGQYYEVDNFRERYNPTPIERNVYPRLDALWQANQQQNKKAAKAPSSQLIGSYAGIGYTNVNPPDPCVAAGPNHVIQMVNGSGGALYKIYDKSGSPITGNISFDNLFSGYSGLGDPIVMYDQLSDRWFLSEFSSSGNRLLVAISLTNDPTGTFHTYVFQATNFPDYPKYSVWPNAYYCTANENSCSIYAFERDSMLVGAPARLIRRSVNNLSGFGFQTLTPVNFEGTQLPTAPTPATFWRHVDDEAHFQFSADPFNDYVEYWTFEPNFDTVTLSTFLGPNKINVTEFDSDLNGYRAFSAIDQKGSSTKLDPLREVFMNRMAYRNFGTYEALVACHVTDVNGSDWAGMRWYEFRKIGTGNWKLHQEGTYAPDGDSRWMAAIQINGNGSICMAYSVSSTNTYPSLRYTGRNINDPIGQMTLPEQIITDGTSANRSNRYGDYAAMTVDPGNDSTFWFTGEFNLSQNWSTRIAHISLSDSCMGLTGITQTSGTFKCPTDTNGSIIVQGLNGTGSNYTYSMDGINFLADSLFAGLKPGMHTIYITDGFCTAELPATIEGPAQIQYVDSVRNISCHDEMDGFIDIVGYGGSGSLRYSLDSSNWTNQAYYTNLDSGSYTVYIKDDSNCILELKPIEIINPDTLFSTYQATPTSSDIAADGEILMSASGGTPPIEYSLYSTVHYSPDSLFTGLAKDIYVVYTRDAMGCKISDTIIVSPLGIPSIFIGNSIQLFPNPTSGEFKVETGNDKELIDATITIKDVTGKEIIRKKIESAHADNLIFNLSGNAKGLYLMSINKGDQIHTLKIILK